MKLRNVKVAKRLGTKTLAGLLAFGLVVGTPSVVLADVQSTMSQSDAVQTEKLQAKSVDGRDTLTDVSDKVMDMIEKGEVKLDEESNYLIDTVTGKKVDPVTGERVEQIPANPDIPGTPDTPDTPSTPDTPTLQIRRIRQIHRIRRVSQRRQVLRMFPVHRMLQENTRQRIINRRQIQLRKKMRQRVQKAIKNLLQSRRL